MSILDTDFNNTTSHGTGALFRVRYGLKIQQPVYKTKVKYIIQNNLYHDSQKISLQWSVYIQFILPKFWLRFRYGDAQVIYFMIVISKYRQVLQQYLQTD